MNKIDKEVFYWSIWKLINYVYGITIVIAILIGLRTLIYLLGGMTDESISRDGMIIVWTIIIVYIIFRNLVKPFFKKKSNSDLNDD